MTYALFAGLVGTTTNAQPEQLDDYSVLGIQGPERGMETGDYGGHHSS